MSFPDHIAPNSLSFHDSETLALNLDWLYLLSMKETDGLSDKSIVKNFTQAEDVQALEAYNDLVEFSRPTYLKLRKDLKAQFDDQSKILSRGLLNSRNEFYIRSSMMQTRILHQMAKQPITMAAYVRSTKEYIYRQCQSIFISPTLNSNPQKWPWAFEEFYTSLHKLESLALFYEPSYIRSPIENNLERLLKDPQMNKVLLFKVLVEYACKVGTFKQFLKLSDLVGLLNEDMRPLVNDTLKMLSKEAKIEKQLHCMNSLCDQGGFYISWVAYFNKLPYHSVTMTSSPHYLFVYISSPVGIMLKVGNGQGGTVAGKVYLSQSLKKQDDVTWVYLHNKLYLRSASKDNGSLEVICPETFNTLSQVTLHCPEIFQHPQMQAINKNYPILTDGDKIFIVGRKLNIQKSQSPNPVVVPSEEEKKKQLQEQLLKREEKKKSSKEKPKEKEEVPDNTIKIMDYVLYEFDLNKPSGIQEEQDSDKKLLSELYDSFQGYFNKAECTRALNLNKNDVQNAAQWLVEEGEKERSKTSVVVSKQTLLCQAEITSDISAKQLKSSSDITCKENSILFPQSVSTQVWTMNREYITAYTEQGVKVFSKNPNDEKALAYEEQFSLQELYQKQSKTRSTLPLRGTYITNIDKHQGAYQQEPNYIVSYEPNTGKYYILHIVWNQVNNVLPALVTVSSDYHTNYRNYNKLENQVYKGVNEYFELELTNALIEVQNHRYNLPTRLNDWRVALELLIKEFSQLMGNMNEEEKKKAASEKVKYIQRLNKLIANSPQQAIHESKKQYAYCIDGSLEELQLLWPLCLKPSQAQSNYLHLLYIWILHSDMSIVMQSTQLCDQIGQHIFDHLQNPQFSCLLIKGWPLFMHSSALQLKFLQINDQQLLQQLLSQIILDYSTIYDEFHLKDSAIIIKDNAKTITTQTEANQIVHNISNNCSQSRFIEPLTRLLIPSLLKQKSIFKHAFPTGFIASNEDIMKESSQQFWVMAKEWATQNNANKWEFLNFMFKQAWSELKYSKCQRMEWQLRHELAKNILNVFEIGLQHQFLLKKPEYFNHFILSMFQTSIVLAPIDVSILQTLQRIFTLIKDNFNYDNTNLFTNLHANQQVGIDQIGVKVFETGHPYERQKVQTFEDTYFPGAIALLVEFDPRCSSDQAHDVLSLNSWYSPHTGSLGAATTLKDPVGISYRVSGKVQGRRHVVMLGNVIQADFQPSGQTRNEHSLNRWGFKLSIRPIYGVKDYIEDNADLLNKFGTSNAISQWINATKILCLLIIENINSLLGFNEIRTQEENDNQQLLKWTLLKNGSVNFQLDKHLVRVLGQTAIPPLQYKNALYLHSVNDQQLFNLKSKEQSRYWNLKRDLMRFNYKFKYTEVEQKTDTDLWDLVISSNQKMSHHIKQIKDKEGEFYKFAKDIIKNFQDSFQYRQEKFRAAYKMQGQEIWQQVEMLLVLAVLYHSGLMQTDVPDIKSYLKDHLTMLQEARNEVINYMIKEVQIEVEYQQNFEGLMLLATELLMQPEQKQQEVPEVAPPVVEPKPQIIKQGKELKVVKVKKQPVKVEPPVVVPQQTQSTKLTPEMENSLWKVLAQRLEGNPDMTQSICQLKGCVYNAEDANGSLRNIFNYMLKHIKDDDQMQSPYARVGTQMIQKILFLLLVSNVQLIGQNIGSNGCHSAQSVDSESVKAKLRPPGLERSISHQVDEKHIDSHKLLKFRQWLDSYQKWKLLHNVQQNEQNAESIDIAPVKSIIHLLKCSVDRQLLTVMELHDMRCVRRIAAMKMLNDFSGQIPNNSILSSYVQGGLLCQGDIMNSRIELASSSAKEVLLNESVKRLNFLMGQVNQMSEYGNYLNQVLAQSPNQQLDVAVLESLKQHCTTLSEINQLFVMENSILWKSREHEYNPHFNPVFTQFLSNVLQTGLLSLAFINLDQQYQSIATLSQQILINVKNTLMIVTDNLLPQESLQCLIELLGKELGIDGYSVNGRLLMKLHDQIGIRRVNFILTHMYDILQVNQHCQSDILLQTLFIILYHSNIPSTVRLCSRIVRIFKNTHLNNISIDLPYSWTTYNLDAFLNGQITIEQLRKTQIPSSTKILKMNNQYNPTQALIDRVGRMLHPSDDEHLPNQLLQELSLIQTKNIKYPEGDKKYKVIIHLCQEEEISILLKVLYWWEELYPTIKLKFPTTVQEYIATREKEKKREEQKSQQQEVIAQQQESNQSQRTQQQMQYKILERVLMTYPDVSGDFKDLPLGWGFNYSNLFGDLKIHPSDNKKHSAGRVKKQIKKYWRPLNFHELERLYDELYKQNDDVKLLVTPEQQEAFLIQRNFISRIYSHLKDLRNYGSLFTVYGCIIFNENFNQQKALQLVELIKLALEDKLQPIPTEGLSEEFKKKADPNKFVMCGPIKEMPAPPKKPPPQKSQSPIQPQPTSGKSQMQVSICDYATYLSYEFRMDYITLLPYGNTSVNFYNEVNRSSQFTQISMNGQVHTQLIYELVNLIQQLSYDGNTLFNAPSQTYQLGLSTVLSGWSSQLGPGMPATLKQHNDRLYIIQGGQQSGQRTCLLIGSNDEKLNLQQVKLEDVELTMNSACNQFTSEEQLEQLGKLILSSKGNRMLLRNLVIVATQVDWSVISKNGQLLSELSEMLLQLSQECQADATEQQFCEAWERLMDCKQPQQLYFPIEQLNQNEQLIMKAETLEKKSSHKIETFEESVESSIYVGSTYQSSLAESSSVGNEQKLVQYWEKYILPKIHDYVKGSLKEYEILDFFEQMRIQLRKGDQPKALEIAYIVCDHRMPNGAVVPDANHDWSTLTMEEVQAGQFVLARLAEKSSEQLYSKDYLMNRRQGIHYICGKIVGVDQRSSSVLVLHQDLLNAQQYATWFPCSSLKQVQVYLPPAATSFQLQTISQQFERELNINVAHKARTLYLKVSQCLGDINYLRYIELAVQEGMSGSCITGWLNELGNSVPIISNKKQQDNSITQAREHILTDLESKLQMGGSNKFAKLNQVLKDYTNNGQFDKIFGWLEDNFQWMNDFVNETKQSLDLQKTHKNPTQLLEKEPDIPIAGLAIVFKNDATLCMCSGIKFYSDPLGINDFYTVANGKEQRNRLPPIILNKKQAYCEYYFNAEAIPIFAQQKCISRLPCILYQIPAMWNVCCYIVDSLATLLMQRKQVDRLKQLTNLLQATFDKLQSPHLLRQSLTKLLMRTARKTMVLADTAFNDNFIQQRLQEATKMWEIQRTEPNVLYSAYLQDLAELIAVALLPIALRNQSMPKLPDWLHSFVQVSILADFFKSGIVLTQEMQDIVNQSLQTQQFDKVISLHNLPEDTTFIKDVLVHQKARVLHPEADIQILGDKAVILLDGWASLDLEQVSQEQRVKEEQIPVEQAPQKFWQCEVCTCAENVWESNVCAACESPAASNKVPFGVDPTAEPEIQEVDLHHEDELAEQQNQARFDELVEKLKQAVDKLYQEKQQQNEQAIISLQKELESTDQSIKLAIKLEDKKANNNSSNYKSLAKIIKSNRQYSSNNTNGNTINQQQIQQQQPTVSTTVTTVPKQSEILQQKYNKIQESIQQLKSLKIENKFKICRGKQAIDDVLFKTVMQNRFGLGTKVTRYQNICQQIEQALFKVFSNESTSIIEQQWKQYFNGTEIPKDREQFTTLLDNLIQIDSVNVWHFLESLGYDFWLNRTSIYKNQRIELLPFPILKQLMKFIEFDVCKETKAVIGYKPTNIRFPSQVNLFENNEEKPINYGEYATSLIQYPELANSQQWLVRMSWALIRLYNQHLDKMAQFINMDIVVGSTFTFQSDQVLLSMANYVSVLRRFCMTPIKIEIVQRVLNKTAINRDSAPKITVERLKLAREGNQKPKGEIVQAKHKDDFLFTTAYEQMKHVPPTLLRPTKPQGTDPYLGFELNFKGEDVQGESGPYRQFFADISRELQSHGDGFRNMHLLHPSTNNQAKIGNAKDKFVLNPSARSTYQLQLFEFLGQLMAVSIRTATHFTLDLPLLFWKQMVGEHITMEDVEQVDSTMCNLISFMQECSSDMFDENIFENWVTLRSDRTMQELKEDGSKISVSFEDRFDYIGKLLEVKLTESQQQGSAIKQGLSSIVPTALLNWISAEDMELWVCGRPNVDVDLLRRHTRYAGELNENSDRIKFLWETLNELTEQEKLRFVKFCWGQERLPANDEEFERNQIRFMVKPATYATKVPNKALPKADTCFFNLELPNYTSKDILKEKLLIAINFDCDSMNAEQRINLDPNARHRRGREEEEEDNSYEMEEEGQF